MAFGHGQRVFGQSKVVHTHIHITRCRQGRQRARQHGHLVCRAGQLHGIDAPLRLKARGQMRIGVQRNTVRPQARHLLQGTVKGLRALLRQTVYQIHIHRLHPLGARCCDQTEHLAGVLHPMHGFLYGGVKVLHAKTQAIKAHGGNGSDTCRIHRARIDFDGNLGAFGEAEIFM